MGRRPCACEAAVNPSSTQPARSILHVRTGPSRQVQALAARLTDRSLVVDVCDDVYRALARLGRAEADTPTVVFICMDDLLPMELEFFKFAKRLNGDLQIYVYGSNGPRDRMTTAIELGADGVVTEDLLDELAGQPVQPPIVESESDSASGGARDEDENVTSDSVPPAEPASGDSVSRPEPLAAPSVDPVGRVEPPPALRIDEESARATGELAQDEGHAGPADIEYDEPTSDEAGDVEDEDDEESMRPVRVPWLRYDQAPPRDPPDAAPRPKPWRPPPPAQPDRSRPLLTEEEVRALMGEDFPETDEPHPEHDGDEPSDGRKNSEDD